MGLSADEEKTLAALMKKKEAPDLPPTPRSLNISFDLGDEKQVERARRLGLIDWIRGGFEEEEQEGKEGKEGKEGDGGDDPPKRGGFFGDS